MKLRALLAAAALLAGFAAVQPAAAESIDGLYINAGGRVVACPTDTPGTCVNGYSFGSVGVGTWTITLADDSTATTGLPVGGRIQIGNTDSELPNLPLSYPFCGSTTFPVTSGKTIALFVGGEAMANCPAAATPGLPATTGGARLHR